MQKGGGLITAEDLANYEVKEREAVRGTYRGYEIISAPPPSSGGITMIETLNILEGYNLASRSGPAGFVDAVDYWKLTGGRFLIERSFWAIRIFLRFRLHN